MDIAQKIQQLKNLAASQDEAARAYHSKQADEQRRRMVRDEIRKGGTTATDEYINETAANPVVPSGPAAQFHEMMAGTSKGARVGQAAVYGSGMSAGAAGLIAIMEALQGAMDNQERRDAPLQ